jgi:inner membrane protein
MKGKTHAISGASVGLVTAIATFDTTLIAAGTIAAGIIGGLIPDIDHRNSTIGKKMKITSWITNKIFGHRGITHTPFLWIILSSLLILGTLYLNLDEYLPIVYGFIIGYGSHLFLDWITKGGIPLLFPFKRKKYNLTPFKSSGWLDVTFMILAVVEPAIFIILFSIF